MDASPIRFVPTEAAVIELMDAITATTARRVASEPDAPYTSGSAMQDRVPAALV